MREWLVWAGLWAVEAGDIADEQWICSAYGSLGYAWRTWADEEPMGLCRTGDLDGRCVCLDAVEGRGGLEGRAYVGRSCDSMLLSGSGG